MLGHSWINSALLQRVSELAAASPRGRRNFNFHRSDDDASHRLLNAIEPGSYIRPHRHLNPAKDETLIVVRGRLGAVMFDEAGKVVDTSVLIAGADCCGVNVTHGTFHTVLALEPKTVFFESKAGPYRPLENAELASWAPAEGERDVAAYLAALQTLFD